MANANALEATANLLEQKGLSLVTDRSVNDIASRLAEKLADRSEQPLAASMVQKTETYLAIEGSVTDVVAPLKALGGTPSFDKAVAAFEQRIEALEDQGSTRAVSSLMLTSVANSNITPALSSRLKSKPAMRRCRSRVVAV